MSDTILGHFWDILFFCFFCLLGGGHVWGHFRIYLEHDWRHFRSCFGHAWFYFLAFVEQIGDMFRTCVAHVWDMFWTWFGRKCGLNYTVNNIQSKNKSGIDHTRGEGPIMPYYAHTRGEGPIISIEHSLQVYALPTLRSTHCRPLLRHLCRCSKATLPKHGFGHERVPVARFDFISRQDGVTTSKKLFERLLDLRDPTKIIKI